MWLKAVETIGVPQMGLGRASGSPLPRSFAEYAGCQLSVTVQELTLELRTRHAVPERKGTIAASGAEGALRLVEGDRVDGEDIL